MSFLSSLFLMALPLALVPLALHFFRRQQRETIAWGAMQFLQQAVRHGRRRERIEELLLLLFRCVAVAALVLAFARPQISSRWLGETPAREVILILDNSMSMARLGEDATPFEQLQQQAEALLNELTPADSIQLMLTVGGPDWLTQEGLPWTPATRQRILQQIRQMKPTAGSSDLLTSVQAAVGAAAGERIQSRQVIVLTDGQSYGWHLQAGHSRSQLREQIEAASIPVSVQVLACGARNPPQANLAFTGFSADSLRVGLQQSVRVRMQLTNTGTQPSPRTTVRQLVDDIPVGEAAVSPLQPGESTTVSWTWSSKSAGVFALSGQLDHHDELPPDNSDGVVIQVVEQIPVLIVDSDPAPADRISSVQLLQAALGRQAGSVEAIWQSELAPLVVDRSGLDRERWSDFDAVVLIGVPDLSPEQMDLLQDYVDGGGGLWLVVSRRTDITRFNAAWYDDGGGLSPLPLQEWISHSDQQEEVIHPPSKDHPATELLSDTSRLDVDQVRISARMTFGQLGPGQETSVLLETGDAAPLVAEQFVGRGRVLVQCLPLDLKGSNLALTRSWVVLVSDWLNYLTSPAAPRFNLKAGARLQVSDRLTDGAAAATLKLPDGEERQLSARQAVSEGGFRHSRTHHPGLYRLRFAGRDDIQQQIPFRVLRDAQESQLDYLTKEQQQALNEMAAVSFPGKIDLDTVATAGLTEQQPVWGPLLMALLAVLLVELVLAARAARFRQPGTADQVALGSVMRPPESTTQPSAVTDRNLKRRSVGRQSTQQTGRP